MTLHTHASMKARGHKDHEAQLRHHAGGGVAHETKAAIKKAIDEHDDQLHGGKHTRLKLNRGGHVEGEHARKRLDRADGGRTGSAKPKSGKGHAANHINIVIAPGGGAKPPMGAPVPAAGGPPMPPHPPMAPPGPAGAPPMGGPAGVPGMPPRPMPGPPVGAGVPGMMPRARGGRTGYPLDDGAGGGEGRLEKIKAYGAKKLGENKDDADGDMENKSAGTGKSPMKRGGRA